MLCCRAALPSCAQCHRVFISTTFIAVAKQKTMCSHKPSLQSLSPCVVHDGRRARRDAGPHTDGSATTWSNGKSAHLAHAQTEKWIHMRRLHLRSDESCFLPRCLRSVPETWTVVAMTVGSESPGSTVVHVHHSFIILNIHSVGCLPAWGLAMVMNMWSVNTVSMWVCSEGGSCGEGGEG